MTLRQLDRLRRILDRGLQAWLKACREAEDLLQVLAVSAQVAKAREAQGANADTLPPEGKPKSSSICVCGGLRDDGTTYCLGHTPTAPTKEANGR